MGTLDWYNRNCPTLIGTADGSTVTDGNPVEVVVDTTSENPDEDLFINITVAGSSSGSTIDQLLVDLYINGSFDTRIWNLNPPDPFTMDPNPWTVALPLTAEVQRAYATEVSLLVSIVGAGDLTWTGEALRIVCTPIDGGGG